jgi:hypothetical protein
VTRSSDQAIRRTAPPAALFSSAIIFTPNYRVLISKSADFHVSIPRCFYLSDRHFNIDSFEEKNILNFEQFNLIHA